MTSVDADSLARFVEELVTALGTPREAAADVASSLVGADLRGHGSHGVRKLPSKYAAEIDDGRIDPAAEPVVAFEDDAVAVVDGQRAFGQLVGRTAVDIAAEKAREYGVGAVGLYRTSHIGRIGEWAERATEDGLAFVAFVCNPGSRWVAPAGSASPRFSTNPVAIGLPTFDAFPFPFVLDIGTSQVAYGKIDKRAAAGEPFPEEWIVDSNGRPITDPDRFEEVDSWAILPLGGRTAGHKGFGLAVMSELLATNVTDSTVSGQPDGVWGNHAVFFAVDLERCTTPERVAQRATTMAEHVERTDFSGDVDVGEAAVGDELLLPGEAEHRTARRRREEGVPLSDSDLASFASLARERGLDEAVVPDAVRDADGS